MQCARLRGKRNGSRLRLDMKKQPQNIRVLSIETSCDETAAALVEARKTGGGFEVEVLSNVVASQIDLHKKWGGVYPELASRAHLEAMIPVLEEAIEPLGKSQSVNLKVQNDNSKLRNLDPIDAVAVTVGPGLIGSLLMGVEMAQILASYFKKPVVPVNHLEGHIYASFVNDAKAKIQNSKIKIEGDVFPLLALVVSGGHTSLVLMKDHLHYQTVGQTIDDAAGEAFDKVARIMDLGYPGGPVIEQLAQSGNEDAYKLPLAMLDRDNLDFSFSGLKTAVLYLTKDPRTGKKLKYNKADLAASFQKTVCEILVKKTLLAIKKYQPKTVILGGGVSANSYLRDYFTKSVSQNSLAQILIPPKNLSTDNAVGIGIAGAIKFLDGQKTSWDKIEARDQFAIDKA